ncbi:MAG: hypothetical protein Q4C01_06580 [Clostridia bacterium]|nr:hypothetical protein [Clostridia bacterium]
MKKFWIILLVAALLFGIGCGNGTSEDGTVNSAEVPETDSTEDTTAEPDTGTVDLGAKYTYYNGISYTSSVIVTADGYYYFGSSELLCYMDRESGYSTILCNRPECKHNSEDCNAYVGSLGSIWLYDEHIYFISLESSSEHGEWGMTSVFLCRMDLDGSNHEVLRDISEPNLFPDWEGDDLQYMQVFDTMSQRFFSHYLIYYANSTVYEYEDDLPIPYDVSYLLCLDLDHPDEAPQIINKVVRDESNNLVEGLTLSQFGCDDNGVYFSSVNRILIDGQRAKTTYLCSYYWDVESGTLTEIEVLNDIDISSNSPHLIENGYYYINDGSLLITTFDGETTTLFPAGFFDGTKLQYAAPYFIVSYPEGETVRKATHMDIYDMEGKLVDTVSLEAANNFALDIIAVTDDEILLMRQTRATYDRPPEYRIDKSQIGSGEIVLEVLDP